MKTASPAFAAILEKRFPEGQKSHRPSQKPAEVLLGGDNPGSFISICRILHFQRDLRKVTPSVQDLLHILRVADKYDVRPAISFCVEVWIRGHVAAVCQIVHAPTSSHFFKADSLVKGQRELDKKAGYDLKTDELFQLLVLCYEFGDKTYFNTISKRIIREHIGSFVTLAATTETNNPGIVWTGALYKIAGALQEEQDRLLFKIFTNIHSKMFSWIQASEALSSVGIDEYVIALEKYGISDVFMPGHLNIERPYSIHEVLTCIQALRSSHFTRHDEYKASLICDRLKSIFRRLERVAGICLPCLDEGLTNCTGEHRETNSDANRE